MNVVDSAQKTDWRQGFLFLGNHLALDFLNTCPVQNGEAVELLPDFDALLRWYQAADLLSGREADSLRQKWGSSAPALNAVETMRKFRERLRKQVAGKERGGTVHRAILDELNLLMAEHPMLTRLKLSGKASTTELWFDPRRPEDLFAPLAHSAAMLLSGADWNRVRMCGQCVLHFYDTSKKGTRRWCSMQLCGNRIKVAAYASRQQVRARR
jgi:predicted RNA-binding Zn ribbon-like protein